MRTADEATMLRTSKPLKFGTRQLVLSNETGRWDEPCRGAATDVVA